MSPGGMDSLGSGEYDAVKSRNRRQRVGAWLTRHLIRREDDVTRTREGNVGAELAGALADGLEVAYGDAIRRAQSLLVAVDEIRLPGFLKGDMQLQEVDPAELEEAIQRWAELCDSPLKRLRADTESCAYLRDEISEDSQLEYSARVSRAEEGLRVSLYRRFARPNTND